MLSRRTHFILDNIDLTIVVISGLVVEVIMALKGLIPSGMLCIFRVERVRHTGGPLHHSLRQDGHGYAVPVRWGSHLH